MIAGVFGRPGTAPMGLVASGLWEAGFEAVYQRPNVWTEHQAQPFDLVVTQGLRLHSRRIADLYRERGVPVLVVDLPPIRREGLWAVWPGEINRLPDSAPDDRLYLVEFGKAELGEKILVCGQKANDAAHGMDAATLANYFSRTVAMCKAKHPEAQVVWRPHPQQEFALSAEQSDPNKETLAEAMDGSGAVVTYNSTCGIEAILAGVPVFCDSSAYYLELADSALPNLDGRDRVPSDGAKRDFFSRLTHCVWTEDELGTATPYLETLKRV